MVDQSRIDDLVWKCMAFTNAKGKRNKLRDDPYASAAEFTHEIDGYNFYIRAQMSGYSNGSHITRVSQNDRVVFECNGNYTASPFNNQLVIYESGEWEELIAGYGRK